MTEETKIAVGNNRLFTKILAIVGSLLVWLPLLAPLLIAAAEYIKFHQFNVDYLMPAELAPLFLVGGGLVLWAALRLHRHARLVGWALVEAAGLLVASMALAIFSGLASGRIGPGTWAWAFAAGMLSGYYLAALFTGIGGVRVVWDVFR